MARRRASTPAAASRHGDQPEHPPGRGLTAYGNLRNALNQSYEEVLGYPAPKLNFVAGMKWACLNIDRRDPGGAVRAGISSGVGRYADAV
jgi:hypothetical protein